MNSIWILVTLAMMSMASEQSLKAEYPVRIRVLQTNPGYYTLVPKDLPLPGYDREKLGQIIGFDRWLPVTDAEVRIGATTLVYDSLKNVYAGMVEWQPNGLIVWVSREGFKPQSRSLTSQPESILSAEFRLARTNELTFYQTETVTPLPDPRAFQKTSYNAGLRLPLTEPPYSVKGCIIGKLAFGEQKKLMEFIKQHRLKLFFFDEPNQVFSFCPGAGQTENWIYNSILPSLLAAPWVESAGPFLYGTSDGYAYATHKAYLEFSHSISTEERDSILASDKIVKIRQSGDRSGLLVDLDPSMGLGVLTWAEMLKQSPLVRYADVKVQFIQTQGLGE